jgi:hypothetical protein
VVRKTARAGPVRAFVDRDGARWDVVLGRESWGALYALFVPAGGAPLRQTLLRADDSLAAQRLVSDMTDTELQDLLERSETRNE